MKSLTQDLNAYAAVAMQIRNSSFMIGEDDFSSEAFEAMERFDEINRLLFDWMVLRNTGLNVPLEQIFLAPIDGLNVMPKHGHETRIHVARPPGPNPISYWDAFSGTVTDKDAVVLSFISLFDWRQDGEVEFELIRGVIRRWAGSSTYVGRQALVPRLAVDVVG